LITAGAILLSREDFLRLAAPITEISDLCEGIAYRLLEFRERRSRISSALLSKMLELSESVLDCVLKLREVVFSLNFNTERVESLSNELESQERKIDEKYRKVVYSIVYSDSAIATILVLKDIVDLLEQISDKAEDATDSARILALSAL
jgi:predicted phosphate transport protein (TIGR00153 family)